MSRSGNDWSVCQYTSKMKVEGFGGKCERTVGSQQGDVVPRRVVTMGVVTRFKTSLNNPLRTADSQATACLSALCPPIYTYTMRADACFVCDCIPFPFRLFTTVSQSVCTPVWVSALLPSSFLSALYAQNEPPTTQKQKADRGVFFLSSYG